MPYKDKGRDKELKREKRMGGLTEEEYKKEKVRRRVEFSEKRKMNGNPRWKGGKGKTSTGYIYIRQENHPFANTDNCVAEHRLIMEAHLGRVLLPSEIVHHTNGNRSENRIENLMLFSSHSEHLKHHRKAG